jgi:hypothetical protein
MSNTLKVLDCDIIYLSYDEPNAEKNYADLCNKVPWAKRVHGVKGSDAAHKACAQLSETDRFVTVDGDNIIDSEFLNQEINFNEHVELKNSVISWCGKNIINGLTYGNGGLKCWPKEYVLNMKTHENADPENLHAQVDFCWNLQYVQMNSTYSTIHNNATPKQAWRAGFREGVKLALDRGIRLPLDEFQKLHWRCLHLLYVWTTVGSDVDNGLWAIYGAREGLYKTMCTDWDYVNVRDFEWLNDYWNTKSLETIDLTLEIEKLGLKLRETLEINVPVVPLDSEQSVFFKSVYEPPVRNKRQRIIDPE